MYNTFNKIFLKKLFEFNILTENIATDLDTQQLITQLREIINSDDFYIEPKKLQKIVRTIYANNKNNSEVSKELENLLIHKVQLTKDKAETIVDTLEREFTYKNLINLTKYLSSRDNGGGLNIDSVTNRKLSLYQLVKEAGIDIENDVVDYLYNITFSSNPSMGKRGNFCFYNI